MKEINEKDLKTVSGGENTENLKKHKAAEPACPNFTMPEYENLKSLPFINFTCSMCSNSQEIRESSTEVYCSLGL